MSPPVRKLSVLITGCSTGGMGSALALAFHAAGHQVYATARDLSKMSDLAAKGIETIQLDIHSASSIASCVKDFSASHTTLDILVNNAGAQFLSPVADIDIPAAKRAFDLNVWDHIAVIQAFLPLLIPAKGIIVNHTSTAAHAALPFQSVYNASKAAFVMLTDTLRLELAPFDVRVVDLRTGLVRTNIISNVQATGSKLPDGSIYTPAKETVEKAMSQEAFQGQGLTAEAWAQGVVHDILKPTPTPVIWRGGSAWMLRVASVLPFGWMDGMAKKVTGMDVVEKILRDQQK